MATETQSIDQFKGKPRLPKFAIPTSYEISLAPDLVSCKFTGYVRIAVDVVSDTRFLVLNAADLQIDNGSVCFESQSSGKALQPSEVVLVEADEIAVFGFSEALPVGKGVLSIKFDGTLNDQMKGFYRSTYEHNGEKKNMAVTQFEPTDARRCFPCWDEPALKSTFKITLEVPSELVALSNMPIKEEKINGSIKVLTYEESPIMSTYLVAFVVGLFDYVEARSTDGTKVRVYCQVGKASQGKLALDVAVKTLDIYRSYFEVPYPLPKLDMVAIPDFSAGAMENYGLVTYRETALLYDEQHSAAANKQRVAVVVAHELAHQWFGNLVTMEWWTHLWLNEGFATWVSYLAADSIFPEWNIWTQFLDDFTMGLRLDALSESHPIEVDINHASEIDEIFDAISYRKGASMIRMLHNYLGADCFQKALASYVKKFAYANAKTEDLWDVLEEESGEPVKTLMDSWTKQKGYPVVSVKLEEGKLLFEQTQFLSSGLSGDGQWIVPITLCCCSYSSQKKFLFKTKNEKLDMAEIVNSSIAESGLVAKGNQQRGGYFWIKFNVDQTGFYRVKYDDELANGLRYAIEANQLSAMDRFGILDDAYAICMAGKQTLSSLLSLMVAYREETDYTVLYLLISICSKIVNVAADAVPELLDDIKLYFVNLLQFSAERVGWDAKEGEGHLDMMLRSVLLVALAYLGHDITQNEALRRFSLFINDRNTPLLPPDTRKAAYVAVMQTVNNSDKSGYENLLKVYRETDLSQEKTRILSSIASSPDPEVVRDALNFLLSPEVRNQDVIFGLAGVSREGRDVAWTWLKDNWEYIKKTWGSGFLLGRFISSIVSPFCSEQKAKEVEEYFASRITPAISRTFKQGIERVQINTKWVQNMKCESNLGAAVKELAYRKY